jgi:hypothetical protein
MQEGHMDERIIAPFLKKERGFLFQIKAAALSGEKPKSIINGPTIVFT